MQLDNVRKYLIAKGIIRGILAAVFGSVSFIIGEATILIALNGIKGLDEWFLPLLLGLFLGGIVIAIPFTTLSGVWLAFELQKYARENQSTKSVVFYKGGVLGFGVGISIFILLVILYFNRGDWCVILSQGILGVVLCVVIAGLTSLNLMKDINALSERNPQK